MADENKAGKTANRDDAPSAGAEQPAAVETVETLKAKLAERDKEIERLGAERQEIESKANQLIIKQRQTIGRLQNALLKAVERMQ